MSFGISFSGGGIKGAAHVGVLLALEEKNIKPSSVSGSSAGSIVAALYSGGYNATDMKHIINKISKQGPYLMDPDYSSLFRSVIQFITTGNITLSGLLRGNKLEKYVDTLLKGKKINELKIRTVIPAVDLNSGKTIAYTNNLSGVKPLDNVIWKTNEKLSKIIRASSSVPAVFTPKFIGKMCLVDGGVTDVLPVDLLIASGEEKVIAIDISESYSKPDNYNIFEIASHSLHLMRDSLCRYEPRNEVLRIIPDLPEDSGLLTFRHIKACMNAGYFATKKVMPQIKAILQSP